jgi:TCP-1/cpn60 chaperonin family
MADLAETGRLIVRASHEYTDIRVLDASLREVSSGTHNVEADLAPGIYRVEGRIPGHTTRELVTVVTGKPTVAPLELDPDSATPLRNVRSTHEYHAGPAVEESRRAHLQYGKNPRARLFLFIRTRGEPEQEVPSVQLCDPKRGTLVAELSEAGKVDLGRGWAALTVDLPAGTYALTQELAEIGQRAQAVFVEDEWETQVFAPWERVPDLSAAAMAIRPYGAGFEPGRFWEYERTEAALEGLARGRLVMARQDLDSFLHGKFENPLLGLIGAYAYLEQPEIDPDRIEVIARNLRRLLPHSPDAAVIEMKAAAHTDLPIDLDLAVLADPPMLATGTELLIALAAERNDIAPPTTWLAEIAPALTAGSAWTRWDSGASPVLARRALRRDLNEITAARGDKPLTELARWVGLPLAVVGAALEARDAPNRREYLAQIAAPLERERRVRIQPEALDLILDSLLAPEHEWERADALGTLEVERVGDLVADVLAAAADRAEPSSNGRGAAIEARINQLRREIEATDSDFDREKLEERLARLAGGVATIKVGAATDVEVKERKQRVEDALQASRAALEEGIVAGGGVALLHAAKAIDLEPLEGDERAGAMIVARALEEPIRQIAANAGAEGALVVSQAWAAAARVGLNVETGEFEDMFVSGIVDPVLVTRSALQNAASIAKSILTTDAVVATPERETGRVERPMEMM